MNSDVDLDHLQEIWTALAKNRLRTFLTAFGVFWGIFLLMLLLGSGNGLKNGIDAGFSGAATNSFFVWGMRTSKPFAGLLAGRSIEFTNADVEELRRQVPEAKVIAPRLQLGGFRGGATVTRGIHTGAYTVMGDMPEIATIQSLAVIARPLPEPARHRRQAQGRGHRQHGCAKSCSRRTRTRSARGSGSTASSSRSSASSARGRAATTASATPRPIFVPFSTFQQAFNAINQVHWMAVTSVDGVPASVAEKKVLEILRARHKVSPQDNRGIGHFNLEEEYGKIQGLFTGIKLLMWIVGVGTLAAGAIGVSNIMLIIVRERTKELGSAAGDRRDAVEGAGADRLRSR